MMKKPMLAALLNLIPLGIGYIYVRRWKRFVATFIVGTIAGFAGLFFAVWLLFGRCFEFDFSDCSSGTYRLALIVFLSLPGAVAAFTSQDAWRIARGETSLGPLPPSRVQRAIDLRRSINLLSLSLAATLVAVLAMSLGLLLIAMGVWPVQTGPRISAVVVSPAHAADAKLFAHTSDSPY